MKEDIKRDSFTSADSFPLKLIQDYETIKRIKEEGQIPLIHAQIIPTNKCNMSCNFCSCEYEDRTQEMPLYKMEGLIDTLASLGTKAVTITGGGEPTMYPHIGTMINKLYNNDIKAGMVTNGLRLDKVSPEYINMLTWCRISNGDFRKMSDAYKNKLETVVKNCPDVDWAFSHVVSSKPNIDEISRVINFANEHDFTHVRLVADLFDTQNVSMEYTKKMIQGNGIDDSKVIYQGRQSPTKGSDCYIGYLKPVISADGNIYMCCGSQYAISGKERKMPEELCMGNIEAINSAMLDNSHVKKGNQCDVCYYSNYNKTLESLMKDVSHKEFL